MQLLLALMHGKRIIGMPYMSGGLFITSVPGRPETGQLDVLMISRDVIFLFLVFFSVCILVFLCNL